MIKIQEKELNDELLKLNSAIKDFSGYSADFISQSKNSLEGFNSVFTDQAKSMLNNMTDTKAPELVKNLEKFSKNIKAMVDEFAYQDDHVINRR